MTNEADKRALARMEAGGWFEYEDPQHEDPQKELLDKIRTAITGGIGAIQGGLETAYGFLKELPGKVKEKAMTLFKTIHEGLTAKNEAGENKLWANILEKMGDLFYAVGAVAENAKTFFENKAQDMKHEAAVIKAKVLRKEIPTRNPEEQRGQYKSLKRPKGRGI